MNQQCSNDGLRNAIASGDYASVRSLLAQEADPNMPLDEQRRTALDVAAEHGRTDIVNLLIDTGASLDGDCYVWPAVENGFWETAQLLWNRRALGRAPGLDSESALLAALGINPFLRFFLELGADANARPGPWGNAVLFHAVQGSLGNVDLLIQAGADPNARNAEGESVLMWAVRNGTSIAVEKLLKAGADPNVFNEQGSDEMVIASTALTEAIKWGPLRSVLALLDGGADVNQTDTEGRTPLMLAAHTLPDLVGYLIDSGADVNTRDKEGRTAKERTEIFHERTIHLLEQGAA